MRRHYTGKQRAELIGLVRSGGATVAEAAARLGVATSTAYYWMRDAATAGGGRSPRRSRAAKPQSPSEPTFVRVVPSGAFGSSILVRVGAAEIQVRRDFDADLLRAVVETLGGAA